MTLPIELGEYTAGERPEPYVYTFEKADGTPINLTGYTATKQVRQPDGTVREAAATITDAAGGQVTHMWDAADLATPGDYQGLIWVGNNTNRYASPPLKWSARPNLGTVPNV